jgi:hypothetical protein
MANKLTNKLKIEFIIILNIMTINIIIIFNKKIKYMIVTINIDERYLIMYIIFFFFFFFNSLIAIIKNKQNNDEIENNNKIENDEIENNNKIENDEIENNNKIENDEIENNNKIENDEIENNNEIENDEIENNNEIENDEIENNNEIENDEIENNNEIENDEIKNNHYIQYYHQEYNDLIPIEYQSEVIYLLCIILNMPIIGVKNYDDYKYNPGLYEPPVYERITVLKYGKVNDGNLNKRIKQIKRDYGAFHIEILCLVKSKDLNIKTISCLENEFKSVINKTDHKLKIIPRQSNGLYKSNIAQEFITVNFETFCVFGNFFNSSYSDIIYDKYNLLDCYNPDSFDKIINNIISNYDLILKTNINNLTRIEEQLIKQCHNDRTNIYKTDQLDDFNQLIN